MENNNDEGDQEAQSVNMEELDAERDVAEKGLGISEKISPSERLIQMKNWEHVEELGGLEIDSSLVCDLEGHDKEKIIMVCASPFCDAPRRLCCGYCNPLHSSHPKLLRKLQTFRDTILESRVKLQNNLADFTQLEKKALVQGTLIAIIKEKQKHIHEMFLRYQSAQYNTLVKMIDGATENYLFEEMAILKTVGGFHSKIEGIFDMNWHDLKKDEILALIKLHENLQEFVEPIQRLDESRNHLSKELSGLLNDVFISFEDHLNSLDSQSEGLMQTTLDKIYSENKMLQNSALTIRSGEELQLLSPKENAANPPKPVAKQTSANKESHSILLKDDNAPKLGWRALQILPKWASFLKNVEICNKKYGPFKKSQKDLPNSMDFSSIGPLEDTRGDIYIGQWRQGLRWGHGTMIQKDGTYYEGSWFKSKMEGLGRKVFRNGNMYEGEFKDDKMSGKGIFNHTGGARYEGEWKFDQPHGRGIELMINNDTFEGEFKKGLKEGKGQLRGKDGSLITGIWKEGKIEGKGEQLYADGRIYKGDFRDDKKEGEGILTWTDGRRYEGPWVKGKQHGIGFFYNPDGTKLKGEWINGNRIRWISEVLPNQK